MQLFGTAMFMGSASAFALSGILPALQAYCRGIVACILMNGHILIAYLIAPKSARQRVASTKNSQNSAS